MSALSSPMLLFWLILLTCDRAGAAAACAMAKWQGNTLDYALAIVEGHPAQAQEAAQRELRDKGFGAFAGGVDVIHPQAVTDLPQAHVVVIRTSYRTARGKERTSYGCGFAAASYEAALWEAMRNLQAHSWGWKPDQHGYQVLDHRRY